MDAGLITVVLPLALAIVMMGLGLELTPKDFARVTQQPKAVLISLFSQLFLLVGVAFLLCKLFALPPLLAVGLMLLAASPGGSTANLFSYLFKGDVALNITLTAINSVLAAITLPLIVNFSINHFMNDGQQVSLQFSKIIQVFSIIIVPVCIGMLIFCPKFHPQDEQACPYFCRGILGSDYHRCLYERACAHHGIFCANWCGNHPVLYHQPDDWLFCATSYGCPYHSSTCLCL